MAPDMPHDPWPGVQSKFYGGWGEGSERCLKWDGQLGGGHFHINPYGTCPFSGYRFSA